ncbi:hypothetical protein RRG08_034823 [Elysia crispata]|uniref:Deacetylase sirtuin-type domain-containing protein n=1 Tax=Elysia crispata TaxID=231223 RepID=A0AAE1E1L6_9GAST|nr:hypothetical protein RRG08_034823 [Elysia crispata]
MKALYRQGKAQKKSRNRNSEFYASCQFSYNIERATKVLPAAMSDKNQGSNFKKKEEERTTESSGAAGLEEAGSTTAESENKSSFSAHMESMSDFLARHLGIKENPPCVLEELTFKGIAKYLASDKVKNVITMAGAGISTSAGIPDFRSPGTGLYDNLASYDLPSPQAIFDIEFFKENPKPFFVLAKELYPGSFKPTLCHYFIKMLDDKGKLLRHYTQNIDTLERVAGLDPEKLIEAHGTFHTAHCLNCHLEFSQDWIKDEIFADKIPKCTLEGCDGVVKPDIVFFGESLPQRFATAVGQDFKKCDLLIVTGTSLMVQPFASLTSRVPAETPRLYINLEKGSTGTHPITVLFFGGGGFNFDGEDNYRDVFKGATCDEGCQELADLLGWGDELKAIVKREHARIDKENSRSSSNNAKSLSVSSSPPKSGSASASTTKASVKSPTAKVSSRSTTSETSGSSSLTTKGKTTKSP